MKKQTAIRLSIIVITISLLSLSMTSCKKKNNTPSTGTFYFHLHTNIDTNEVDDTTALYRDATGRHFGLSVAQFYISGVTLHNVNGSSYTISGIVLKNIDSEQYVIGTAPIGTYDDVTFNVGLDATTNALQPAGFTTNGYIPNTGMWFGNSTQGYMFMKLQGFADTTATQTGTNLVNFSYEIGSASNLKTVTMPARSGALAPYILTKDGNQFIHIICDYGALLSVVNFNTQDSTDTYNINPALSTTIANNFPNLFRYEE